jgi:hypothetical protein
MGLDVLPALPHAHLQSMSCVLPGVAEEPLKVLPTPAWAQAAEFSVPKTLDLRVPCSHQSFVPVPPMCVQVPELPGNSSRAESHLHPQKLMTSTGRGQELRMQGGRGAFLGAIFPFATALAWAL